MNATSLSATSPTSSLFVAPPSASTSTSGEAALVRQNFARQLGRACGKPSQAPEKEPQAGRPDAGLGAGTGEKTASAEAAAASARQSRPPAPAGAALDAASAAGRAADAPSRSGSASEDAATARGPRSAADEPAQEDGRVDPDATANAAAQACTWQHTMAARARAAKASASTPSSGTGSVTGAAADKDALLRMGDGAPGSSATRGPFGTDRRGEAGYGANSANSANSANDPRGPNGAGKPGHSPVEGPDCELPGLANLSTRSDTAAARAIAGASDAMARSPATDAAERGADRAGVGSAFATTLGALLPAAIGAASGDFAAATTASIGAHPGSPEFAPQIGHTLTTFAKDGVQEARLELNPAELGPVSVRIQLEGAAVQVHLAADHGLTRGALEAALPTLAAELREAGLMLAGGGVSDQGRNAGSSGADSGPNGVGRAGPNAGRDAAEVAPSDVGAPASPTMRQRSLVDLVA